MVTELIPELDLVDAGRYGESWKQAASLFQEKVPAAQWERAVRSAREPLGKVESRKLVNAQFVESTRAGILRVIDRLIDSRNVDAIILGGTELPLLLSGDDYRGLPLLDTTAIHVVAVVERLLA